MPQLYPIHLLLEGRECLVVGGGRVAARKVKDLLACGARVTVVSPEFAEEVRRLGRAALVQRPFEDADADGRALVIAATSEPEVNRRVARAARHRGVLVNVVDTPDECDFYVPATFRRGGLAVSVSTGGASPALARRIREQLEGLFPEGYADYVELLAELRAETMARVADAAARRAIFTRLAAEQTWRLFQAQGPDAVRALARQLVAEAT